MAYSETFPYNGSNDLYVKPVSPGSLPSNSPSWSDDSIDFNSVGFGAVSFTGLTDGQTYWVFEKIGGSKASTDPQLGIISSDTASDISAITSDVTTIVQEIVKIPRASGTLTAGGTFTRKKTSSDTNNFIEHLE